MTPCLFYVQFVVKFILLFFSLKNLRCNLELRIDFTTMQLAAPGAVSATALQADSNTVGDCQTDTLTVKTGGCGR